MIGYYAHHQGRGHRQRAAVLAPYLTAVTGEPVTVLSSAPPPAGTTTRWLVLDRDDDPAADSAAVLAGDPTARGRLHWAPLGHTGLRRRTTAISGWLAAQDVRLLVADVSQEVALLARLHGVPVVSVVLPGERDDPAHDLGLGLSDALVGFWPTSAHGMVRGSDLSRLQAVGSLSRFSPLPSSSRAGQRTVTVLDSRGGTGFDPAALSMAEAATPDWRWRRLGVGAWTEDPWPALIDSDVVLCHAGQSSLADVAAARVPAIVVPEDRPHAEQHTTARVLAAGPWPVLVEAALPVDGWPARLERAAALDGTDWASWCDGRAAFRFAEVVAGVLARSSLREASA